MSVVNLSIVCKPEKKKEKKKSIVHISLEVTEKERELNSRFRPIECTINCELNTGFFLYCSPILKLLDLLS